jgi:hypothetical protein
MFHMTERRRCIITPPYLHFPLAPPAPYKGPIFCRSCMHPPWHSQKKVGNRAAVAMRVVQARVHAGGAALHNKTYPLRMILDALTTYDLGCSLQETAARLKKKTNRSVSPSTITAPLALPRRKQSVLKKPSGASRISARRDDETQRSRVPSYAGAREAS